MIGINLIDAHELAVRRRNRRLRRWTVVTLGVSVIAAAPVAVELTRHRKVQALRNEKVVLGSRIEATREKLNDIAADIRILRARMDRANALRAKRPWSRMLTVFSQTLPKELWLTSFSTDPAVASRGNKDFSIPAAPSKGAKEDDDSPRIVTMDAPRTLLCEGYALAHSDLYEFMSTLKHTALFSDIQLTKATEEPIFQSKAVRFKIECHW